MVAELRVNLPGLLKERMRSGRVRYRVRVAGYKYRRIALHVGPDHPDFMTHYNAARAGISTDIEEPQNSAIPKSVAWLSFTFEAAMLKRVSAGLMHPAP